MSLSTHDVQSQKVKKVLSSEKPKAHIIRRNIEDFLEKKALERRLTEVFDSNYHPDY